MSEGPDDSFKRQASGDLSVFDDVFAIIIIQKLVVKRLPEDQPGKCRETKANAQNRPAAVQRKRRCCARGSSFFRSPAHSIVVALPAMPKIQHNRFSSPAKLQTRKVCTMTNNSRRDE